MKKEIWKDVPGYEGRYQVSNFGNVKNIRTGRILKPNIIGSHHKAYAVKLSADGVGKTFFVHRIEYAAFHGPIPNGMQVNHIDENTFNNDLDNLNLMTAKENINWGTRNKRSAEHRINHPKRSKWVIKLTKDNEILHFYPSVGQAFRETGIEYSNIAACCRGKRPYAGGFIWKYAS